jgi:Co/Zn/Cd efflux system component
MAEPSQVPKLIVNLRRTVAVVAALNFAYFFIEFGVARAIGSVSLFADSIDFLEDTTINVLILVALGWTASKRRVVGMGLAALLLVPGFAALWTAWDKIANPVIAEPVLLTLTGLGALLVNFTCAALLARVRHDGGSLTKAAFMSARNDVMANIGIIAAGTLTWATGTIWPDLIVGLAIAALNAEAAYEVYAAAQVETDEDGNTLDQISPARVKP